MGAKIVASPEEAKKALLAAFVTAEGNREKMARALRTSERTLYRWIGRLDAWSELDALCEEHGFAVIHGPPRGERRSRRGRR